MMLHLKQMDFTFQDGRNETSASQLYAQDDGKNAISKHCNTFLTILVKL